jgi:YfiR/HmsC-like
MSMRPARKFVNKCLLLFLILTLSGTSVRALQSNEYQIKAGFLLNFIRFVDWPVEVFADDNGMIVIGVIGDDPFGSVLDEIVSGKTIGGRGLEVRRLKWGQDLKACHLLFVSTSERKRVVQLIDSLKGASVLTVGEMPQFNQQGGIINFVMEANRVRFEINVPMADRARLRISSKLLALAKTTRN